ncbi:MAG: ROK family protein [Candidatus Doudnabacteria bacterium]|nr:ROK family protein [Candidatus Doudnabacteria bacterium]
MEPRKKIARGIVGLDIGGTKMEAVLSSGQKIIRVQKARTPRNRRTFLKAVANLIAAVAQGQNYAGVGLGLAGALDKRKGIVLNSPNLKFLNGWRIVAALEKIIHRLICLENDANCFLLGELAFGQARGKNNVVALTLGTGVGGAVFTEGKFLHGRHGAAGELGHMIIDNQKSVEDLVSSHSFQSDPLAVQNAGFAGSKKARAVYHRLGKNLGVALANYINIFDPEIIILGGGIARAAPLFLPSAKAEMKKHTLLPPEKLPKIVISRLKYAAALGAATLVTKPLN